MRLFEIMDLAPLNTSDSKSRAIKLYNEAQTKKHISNIGEYEVIETEGLGSGSKRWFLIKNDEPVGSFLFKQVIGITKPYWSITYAWLDNSLRGQGLASQIYTLAIKENGALMSDIDQTADSQKIWKSLFNKFNCYGIFWNQNDEMEWAKIETKEELDKAWPPVDKYKRLLLTSGSIDTRES